MCLVRCRINRCEADVRYPHDGGVLQLSWRQECAQLHVKRVANSSYMPPHRMLSVTVTVFGSRIVAAALLGCARTSASHMPWPGNKQDTPTVLLTVRRCPFKHTLCIPLCTSFVSCKYASVPSQNCNVYTAKHRNLHCANTVICLSATLTGSF